MELRTPDRLHILQRRDGNKARSIGVTWLHLNDSARKRKKYLNKLETFVYRLVDWKKSISKAKVKLASIDDLMIYALARIKLLL